MSDRLCPVCSNLLPESKSRPFVYCSVACKFKSFRQRHKTQRILSVSEKPQRISEKPLRISASNKTIGVSGTVHNMPQTQPVKTCPGGHFRNVDDLKRLFCE